MKNTLSRSVAVATLLGAGVAAAFAGVSLREQRSAARVAPRLAGMETLDETGLSTLDPMPFTPQYPLWSDGATKRRWLYLPPGASIDASNADAWQFPVGTRVWKEFSFGGHRVETRVMSRETDGWHYATFVWNADGTDAVRAPARGAMSVEVAPGVNHRIPSEADCRACHATGPTPVLGFAALQLSSDRDPNAPHAETPMSGAVTLTDLVARGLVRGVTDIAPRIPGDDVERSARGYLHGNCGGCHRADGPLASIGMELHVSVAHPMTSRSTVVGASSHFLSPALRIAPGNSDDSVVLRRMSSRDAATQMPPIGTQIVDSQATALIATWIDQLAPNHH